MWDINSYRDFLRKNCRITIASSLIILSMISRRSWHSPGTEPTTPLVQSCVEGCHRQHTLEIRHLGPLKVLAKDAAALFDDLPGLDESLDFVPQLKDPILVMHQHGLLQYEVLHGAGQSVPLHHHRFAQPANNVLVVGRAIQDARPDFHQAMQPLHE